MTTKIRAGVFETNSSSTHSISICSGNPELYNTILFDSSGVIILTGGEFGWENESYNDAWSKANYAAIYAEENDEARAMLSKVICAHTGAKEVQFDISGYIDHQSFDVVEDAFENEETLRDFIFNPHSYLETDNDNH